VEMRKLAPGCQCQWTCGNFAVTQYRHDNVALRTTASKLWTLRLSK